jgi:hypothetical protein
MDFYKYSYQEDEFDEPDNGGDNTIIIGYYSLESKAQLASAYLRQHQIPNFLSNTFSNQVLPFQQACIALHVNSRDKDRAIELISEIESGELSDAEEIIVDLDQGVVTIKEKMTQELLPGRWILFLIILLILVLLVHSFIRWQGGYTFW